MILQKKTDWFEKTKFQTKFRNSLNSNLLTVSYKAYLNTAFFATPEKAASWGVDPYFTDHFI